MQILAFHATQFEVIDRNGQAWLRSPQIAGALGYNRADRISDIYNRHAAEFTDAMTALVELPTAGGVQQVRIFSLRGAHLLGMFARTPVAQEFRRWVLDVLDAQPTSHMATLIGQTIGTDGFHMLGSLIKGKVSSLPVSAQRRATAKIWSQTHAAFGVRSAADIPAEQLDAARNFIAAYNVLEGEYIEGRKVGGLYLDDYETHHLYLLMSRFAIMSEHRGSMLAAARALDSKPLWTIFGQLDEGRSSFSKLDQRRAELYAIYSKDGFRGGYAMPSQAAAR